MICSGKNLLVKTAVWLVAEILLNFPGVDNLGDYSEFIFEVNVAVELKSTFGQKRSLLRNQPSLGV